MWDAAEVDCDNTLAVDPNHLKAMIRRAAARLELNKAEAALQVCAHTAWCALVGVLLCAVVCVCLCCSYVYWVLQVCVDCLLQHGCAYM
jgi:hypothetical protein